MFTTLIVQPIFNLLVAIYALLPGHNFGLAVILFTIVIRILLWPLLKKQLHNAKAMRKLQPELKRIKKEAAGDRARESAMVMELYKERGVNPFSSIGLLIIQLPILIGLYVGLTRIINDPNEIINFAYPFLRELNLMKELAADISKLDLTLFGFIDLTKPALSNGSIYWPAMALVVGSAITQYFQSKQLMPDDKDARKLRHILRDAGKGEQADSAEVNAAVSRSVRFLIPAMIFIFTVNIASALSLYWLTSGLVAIYQQGRILRDEEEELEETMHKDDKKSADKPKKKVKSTARVVSITSEESASKTQAKAKTNKSKKKSSKSGSKRANKKRR